MSAADATPLVALSDALAAAAARAAEAVVAVHGDGRTGSGVVWRAGHVVAAEEVLRGEEGLSVTRPDGATVDAELVGRDPSTDVALLRCDTGTAPDWSPAPAPALGSLALVVGRDAGPIAVLGTVAEAGEAWTSAQGGRIDSLVRLSVMLSHRIEGGAAVAPDGRLIGLTVADPRRRGLVIPVATVERAVAALAERGYVARGYIGLGLHPLRRGGSAGVLVVDVVPDGPAARAGFLLGDTVTTWDGSPVGRLNDVMRRLGTDAVGRTVAVGVIRAGAPLELALTVGERGLGREG